MDFIILFIIYNIYIKDIKKSKISNINFKKTIKNLYKYYYKSKKSEIIYI